MSASLCVNEMYTKLETLAASLVLSIVFLLWEQTYYVMHNVTVFILACAKYD